MPNPEEIIECKPMKNRDTRCGKIDDANHRVGEYFMHGKELKVNVLTTKTMIREV